MDVVLTVIVFKESVIPVIPDKLSFKGYQLEDRDILPMKDFVWISLKLMSLYE